MKSGNIWPAVSLGAVLSLGLLGEASDASAQAWVDAPGTLGVSTDYTFGFSDALIDTEGEEIDGVDITNHSATLSGEYAPIERLGVTASVPVHVLKYTGDANIFPEHGNFDDGSSNFALTDLRVGARYQFLGPFKVLTPHLAFTLPTNSYETQGYAGAGRGLMKLHAGLSGGYIPSSLPRLFLHGTYEFSLSESYEGDGENFFRPDEELTDEERETLSSYGQNSSEVHTQVGYFFLDNKLDVHAAFDAHWQHGGADFATIGEAGTVVIEHHDALLNENFYLVGAGASYRITDRLRTSLSLRYFLAGKNTRNVSALGLGVAYQML